MFLSIVNSKKNIITKDSIPNMSTVAKTLATSPTNKVKINKILLIVAIAYTLSPVDIIPDSIPFFGTLDDLLIWITQIIQIVNSTKTEKKTSKNSIVN
jgi:uncharacterized membrane protein YkvA (DUF1232 family)